MLVIAFDTATPAVTVALHDGTHVLAETTTVNARRHGELLASSIDAVLTEAGAGRLDLTAVAAGTGPGPYTGLRGGLVTARVLGSALGIPVYGVCTLDVIAAEVAGRAPPRARSSSWPPTPGGARCTGPVTTRGQPPGRSRGRHPGRRGGDSDRGGEPRSAGSGRTPPPGILAAGEGALLYPGVLGQPLEPSYPAAGTLAGLAAQQLTAGGPGTGAEPIYLRGPDARVPGPPKRVTIP